MILQDVWKNCYNSGYRGIILDAAMAHPAKYSRALIARIIAHALEEGWVQPGGVVLDPFAGVATGALPCLQSGLHYVGVELESKFVELARENINLWNDRYAAHFPRWGSAQIYQGDSRRLVEVVQGAGLVVSSPPYVDSMEKRGGIDPGKSNHIGGPHSQMNRSDTRYGSADGQLGAMPPGDISAIISSPPFAGNTGGRGEASRNGIDAALFDRHSGGMIGGMGDEPGNLGNLPMGTLVVGSPPYEGSNQDYQEGYKWAKPQGGTAQTNYGNSNGQIGATQGQTFWEAAAAIVSQCALLLPPGGAAIWVLKGYIKSGKYVDFPGQWQALCESCGFETIHIHRAMLVKDNGEQETMAAGHDTTGSMTNLLGDEVTTNGKPLANKKNIVSRKSFFRRLHERKNPHLSIDFETVLCTRKAT